MLLALRTSHGSPTLPALRRPAVAVLALLLALTVALLPGTPADARGDSPKPTVVLVHGAFADASGWNDVVRRLQREGYVVHAPANPLRGLQSDAAYLRSFLSDITGPVVLVGHSYGGAVITNAATGDPDIEALVYVAAYGLDEGETVEAANHLGGGQSTLIDDLVFRPFPGSGTTDADAYVEPEEFRRIFAADLPRHQTTVMAATQRPGVISSLLTPSGPPAWESIPSWYLVANDDNLIPPVAQRVMATRMRATTVDIDSSHVAMMSKPGAVTALIRDAAGDA